MSYSPKLPIELKSMYVGLQLPRQNRSFSVINLSVCVCVCLSVRYISGTAKPIFAKFFVHTPVAVTRSSSGGIAIGYVLPVFRMTSRLAVVGHMAYVKAGAESDIYECHVCRECELPKTIPIYLTKAPFIPAVKLTNHLDRYAGKLSLAIHSWLWVQWVNGRAPIKNVRKEEDRGLSQTRREVERVDWEGRVQTDLADVHYG